MTARVLAAALAALALGAASGVRAQPVPQPTASAAPDVPAVASPSPAGTPPAPSPPPAPLALATGRLQLVLGSSLALPVSGGVPPYAATLSAPVATLATDPATGLPSLAAPRSGGGTAIVVVTDAAGASVSASLLVAPAAGFVPADVALALTGSPTADFVQAQLRGAVARATRSLPGTALVTAPAPLPSGFAPGDRFDAPVAVRLDGGGRTVDVAGTATVHVAVGDAAAAAPGTLLYSDDPEQLRADGVLLRATVDSGAPARLYYYHQAAVAGKSVVVALDAPAGGATVQIVGHGAGPNAAVNFVGQTATYRYLDDRARGAGVVVDVPVGGRTLLQTADRPMAAGTLVAGALDIAVLAGDPVRVTVLAVSDPSDVAGLIEAPELPSDGKGRRGRYDVAAPPPIALALAAGGAEPAPVAVGGGGAAGAPSLAAGGRPLAGAYGVLVPVSLALSNPTPEPATLYLYEQPIGYPVTTTIAFAGDPAPTRVACVKQPVRYLVRAFSLAAGAAQTVSGDYMTDGGSTYPLAFGLTQAPPSPQPASMTAPDGCYPKPAAAAPATGAAAAATPRG